MCLCVCVCVCVCVRVCVFICEINKISSQMPSLNHSLLHHFAGSTQEQLLHKRQNEVWDSLDADTQATYGKEYLSSIYAHLATTTQGFPADLTPAVRCIRSALLSMRPRACYPTGKGEELVICLHPLLPVWLADRIMASFGLLPRHLKPAALL